MSRGSARVHEDLEVGIREVLTRIIDSTTDVADLGEVSPRNERLRHELTRDVLIDACVLASMVAKARADMLDPTDVFLRREAREDAVAAFEEVIEQARRHVECLTVRAPAAIEPVQELRRPTPVRGINWLTFNAAGVA
jgi:radical SAM superfamily enzyme YgiQ (UPF0313 family)